MVHNSDAHYFELCFNIFIKFSCIYLLRTRKKCNWLPGANIHTKYEKIFNKSTKYAKDSRYSYNT